MHAHLAALADDAGRVVHAAAERHLVRLKHVQHACQDPGTCGVSLDMLDVPGSGWCLMIPTSALQVARKMQAVLPYIFGGMHLQWNAEQENPAMGMYRLGCCGAHTRTHLG